MAPNVGKNRKGPDWNRIKAEYLKGGISYRDLASKHGVSFDTLKDRAKRESWSDLRDETHHRITTKTQQKIADSASSDGGALDLEEARRILAKLARDDKTPPQSRIAALKLAGDWSRWSTPTSAGGLSDALAELRARRDARAGGDAR